MTRGLFTIKNNTLIAERTWRLVLSADDEDFHFSGEFVNVAIDGFYLRRPLSVCDAQGSTITLIYKCVGEGTKVLSTYLQGRKIELLTGLGRGFDATLCKQSALLVGGGLGSAALYTLAKRLKETGKQVHVVLGFNKADEIVLDKEYSKLCDSVSIATMDGSVGTKGFVTDAIAKLSINFDCFYTCGPMTMMKAVCTALEYPGQASLEERMGCGAGYCYGCSCKTLLGTKRICKDGPVFDKEEIIW